MPRISILRGSLESYFKWPSVKSTPIEVPGTETAKGRQSVRISRKDRNGVLTPSRDIMNELTGKDEQPNAMANTRKERYLVSEFLRNPVLWLETESLYYSYTTRGEAQEVANGIDRMISDGAPVGQSKLFPRAKHSRARSDTAFDS